MDICLTCSKEYDPMMEPDHEQDCAEKYAEDFVIKEKSIPELKRILEGLLNEKKED